jgi:hypothetical protein
LEISISVYIYIYTQHKESKDMSSSSSNNHLSAYEIARLERIKFIQNEIKKIGALKKIKNMQKDMRKQVAKPKRPRVIRRKKPVAPSDKRASGRLAGKKVEYTKEIVDNFGVVEEVYGPDGVTKIVSITFIYIFFHVISFFSRNLNHDIYIYSNIKLLYIYICSYIYNRRKKRRNKRKKFNVKCLLQ